MEDYSCYVGEVILNEFIQMCFICCSDDFCSCELQGENKDVLQRFPQTECFILGKLTITLYLNLWVSSKRNRIYLNILDS